MKRAFLTGWREEITPLSLLIYLRLLGGGTYTDIDVRDPTQADSIKGQVSPSQREFVELRVVARIRWYANTVDGINTARAAISGTVAGGGALIASLTATHQSSGLSWQNYVVIVLGVIVAVLGAVGPGLARVEQKERYRRGGNRLRSEAWRFALKREPYDTEDEQAFATFVDKVDEIEREAIATESDTTQEK